jgi:hypothetical protein
MLKFVSGDFFDYEADIRVNTVNCVGVMGAGVALLFKTKYPDMYKQYVKDCKNGLIKPGAPTIWSEEMQRRLPSITALKDKLKTSHPSLLPLIDSKEEEWLKRIEVQSEKDDQDNKLRNERFEW